MVIEPRQPAPFLSTPERCEHEAHHRGVPVARCSRRRGHSGLHLYRCADPSCPGRMYPASVYSHPPNCGAVPTGDDIEDRS